MAPARDGGADRGTNRRPAPTADGEQWNDPDRLESDAGGSDISAAGFAAGLVAFGVLLYFLWIGAHSEAVRALWAIAALGVVGMLLHGLRGGR